MASARLSMLIMPSDQPLRVAWNRLLGQLLEAGDPLPTLLRPGLGSREIEATVADVVGLRLPDVAVAWLQLQNGPTHRGGAQLAASSLGITSLSALLDRYAENRRDAVSLASEFGSEDWLWPRTFFPLSTMGSATLGVDCSHDPTRGAMRVFYPGGEPVAVRPTVPSMLTVLDAISDLIVSAVYRWNGSFWVHDAEVPITELDGTGIL